VTAVCCSKKANWKRDDALALPLKRG